MKTAKNDCAACRKCSGRRQNLSSGAFRSEIPFGSGLGQTEKSQNSPSKKVRNMQKNPDEIERFQPDLVGVSGFEPEASWSRTKRDTKLRHTPKRFKNYILLSRKLQELFSIKSPVAQNYSVRGAGEPNLSAPLRSISLCVFPRGLFWSRPISFLRGDRIAGLLRIL